MKTIKTILEEETRQKVVWNDNFGVYALNLDSKEDALKIADSEKIKENFDIEIVEAGKRAFLNFSPKENVLTNVLTNILTKDRFEFLSNKIQVEFVSANPTGLLTLGNGRGGVYGDVLGNILEKAGAKVTKEYYINDAGNQINELGRSVLGDEEGQYKGEYIDELAKEIKGSSPKEVGQKAQEKILKNIKKTVSEMGIEFDEWFSEQKELRDKGKVEEIIKWFKDKKLSYEKDGALWFKASEFGDIEDRVLVKENGEFTYFAVDCAYHKNKFEERKFDKVINVWGADHHGTVPRLEGFVEALGFKEKLEIILMQFVRLVKGGKSVKMSKREGNFVLVDDVLKEVGKDVFRYFMLTRSTNTHMDFDMELAKEQSKKNPVYYIQYAHARMQSILHKSQISNLKSQIIPNLEILNSKNERALILKLAKFPEIIEDISKDYQVHHLTTYAYELAKTFTDFYENESVLNAETKELKEIRLRLVGVTRQVLNDVLVLLGIEAPKKM